MKICVAQTRPIEGDIESNILMHKKLIDCAINDGANIIIFPELSLTGYEPALARALAISKDDKRLEVFQTICDEHKVVIGVGVPIQSREGICISMILFQPMLDRLMYSKKYLHPDEEDYFVHGHNFPVLRTGASNLALAICYEISVTQHAEDAFTQGAEIYIASVAKFVYGIDAATKRLSNIAKKYSSMVLMANCIGQSDGNICAGKTSVWNTQGELISQLDDHHEGIILVDTETQAVLARTI
jgi:predicted amidohydrolase